MQITRARPLGNRDGGAPCLLRSHDLIARWKSSFFRNKRFFKMTSPYVAQWKERFRADGGFPEDAYVCGHEQNGSPLYACRVRMENNTRQIGKCSREAAYIPYGGEEHCYREYDVLLAPHGGQGFFQWCLATRSSIPSTAVPAGKDHGNKDLYIARVEYEGGVHPGKAGSHLQGGAAFSFDGKELNSELFQVLCYNPPPLPSSPQASPSLSPPSSSSASSSPSSPLPSIIAPLRSPLASMKRMIESVYAEPSHPQLTAKGVTPQPAPGFSSSSSSSSSSSPPPSSPSASPSSSSSNNSLPSSSNQSLRNSAGSFPSASLSSLIRDRIESNKDNTPHSAPPSLRTSQTMQEENDTGRSREGPDLLKAADKLASLQTRTPERLPEHSLYLGNLPRSLTTANFEHFLAGICPFYSSFKLSERSKGNSGFVFIFFRNERDKEKALASLSPFPLQGRKLIAHDIAKPWLKDILEEDRRSEEEEDDSDLERDEEEEDESNVGVSVIVEKEMKRKQKGGESPSIVVRVTVKK